MSSIRRFVVSRIKTIIAFILPDVKIGENVDRTSFHSSPIKPINCRDQTYNSSTLTLVKVINLEYGDLEPRKRGSRINLEFRVCGVGRLGCVGGVVLGLRAVLGPWCGSMIMGVAMSSGIRDPRFRNPHIRG